MKALDNLTGRDCFRIKAEIGRVREAEDVRRARRGDRERRDPVLVECERRQFSSEPPHVPFALDCGVDQVRDEGFPNRVLAEELSGLAGHILRERNELSADVASASETTDELQRWSERS